MRNGPRAILIAVPIMVAVTVAIIVRARSEAAPPYPISLSAPPDEAAKRFEEALFHFDFPTAAALTCNRVRPEIVKAGVESQRATSAMSSSDRASALAYMTYEEQNFRPFDSYSVASNDGKQAMVIWSGVNEFGKHSNQIPIVLESGAWHVCPDLNALASYGAQPTPLPASVLSCIAGQLSQMPPSMRQSLADSVRQMCTIQYQSIQQACKSFPNTPDGQFYRQQAGCSV